MDTLRYVVVVVVGVAVGALVHFLTKPAVVVAPKVQEKVLPKVEAPKPVEAVKVEPKKVEEPTKKKGKARQ